MAKAWPFCSDMQLRRKEDSRSPEDHACSTLYWSSEQPRIRRSSSWARLVMLTPPITESFIAAKNVRSLTCFGDSLIDWVDGGAVYELNGRSRRGGVNYAFKFDAAVSSPDGEFAVIYCRVG